MKALVWHGKTDIRCDSAVDPTVKLYKTFRAKQDGCIKVVLKP